MNKQTLVCERKNQYSLRPVWTNINVLHIGIFSKPIKHSVLDGHFDNGIIDRQVNNVEIFGIITAVLYNAFII